MVSSRTSSRRFGDFMEMSAKSCAKISPKPTRRRSLIKLIPGAAPCSRQCWFSSRRHGGKRRTPRGSGDSTDDTTPPPTRTTASVTASRRPFQQKPGRTLALHSVVEGAAGNGMGSRSTMITWSNCSRRIPAGPQPGGSGTKAENDSAQGQGALARLERVHTAPSASSRSRARFLDSQAS